jgi:hypothetical protein
MILLNQKLGIGLSGYSTGRGFRSGDGVDFRYGGVKVEYTFRPSKRFHFSVPILLGMGSANDRLGLDNDNRYPQPWGGIEKWLWKSLFCSARRHKSGR